LIPPETFPIKHLQQYQRKFKIFRKLYEPHFKNKTSGFKKSPELMKSYKYILYMDLLAPYVLTNTSKISEDITIDFNLQFQKFLHDTPKR
jgi:hypothetical protein